MKGKKMREKKVITVKGRTASVRTIAAVGCFFFYLFHLSFLLKKKQQNINNLFSPFC
jgi:hypothetical protein